MLLLSTTRSAEKCANERVLRRATRGQPDIGCQSSRRRAKPGPEPLPRKGLMVNECSFARRDRSSTFDRRPARSLPPPPVSFCEPRPRGKIRSDGCRALSVAYIDTNHRLPFGSPSGFLVAVRQNPIATAVSLSCPEATLPFSRNTGREADSDGRGTHSRCTHRDRLTFLSPGFLFHFSLYCIFSKNPSYHSYHVFKNVAILITILE